MEEIEEIENDSITALITVAGKDSYNIERSFQVKGYWAGSLTVNVYFSLSDEWREMDVFTYMENPQFKSEEELENALKERYTVEHILEILDANIY